MGGPGLPPRPQASFAYSWHQDGDRANQDIETSSRPRLSVKVAYFLSGVSTPNRGNLHLIPGSHLQDEIDLPPDAAKLPGGGIPVLASPGTAVVFDRRIWHSRGPNNSTVTRKALFSVYAHRWIRPRNQVEVSDEQWPGLSPVRRQLLGDGTSLRGFTSRRTRTSRCGDTSQPSRAPRSGSAGPMPAEPV